MDFTVRRDAILEALGGVKSATDTKITIPILGNVLLEAEGEAVRLTATDLEMTLESTCAAKVRTPGSGTAPARKLFELLSLFPDEEARVRLLENQWHEITSGSKRYKLVGMAVDNFPKKAAQPPTIVRIPYGKLEELIERTGYAISKEDSRYTLNGALLELTPGQAKMVATDGHRLAIAETAIEGTATARLLIPSRALNALRGFKFSAGAEIEIGANENSLLFSCGERRLTARLLTGQFPNYEAVIPKASNRMLTVESAVLSAALHRVAQMADSRSRAIKLTLGGEAPEISSASPEYGEAKETIEAGYVGEPLAIGFNADCLLEFLAVAEGKIELRLGDESTAGLFQPIDQPGFRYVVMPMRV